MDASLISIGCSLAHSIAALTIPSAVVDVSYFQEELALLISALRTDVVLVDFESMSAG